DELGGFTSVSFGYEHACGISSSLAFCWGKGGGGMLGNASTEDSSAPVAVDTSGVLAGKTITDISAGRNRTCAVADGQAYCWGLNGSVGALGNNSTVDSLVPVAVDTTGALQGKTVTKISAGQSHTCAIADGKAYCWGINNSGHLGDGTSTHRLAPVAVNTSGVLADKTVTDIAAGWNFTCAVADSNAYCWGYNYAGDLGGGGGRYNNHYSPIAVHTGAFSGKQVTDISVGLYHACLLADGAPYCWGNGSYGVGNGGDSRYYTPVATSMSGVLANKTVTAISAGYNNTCVIADNQAYCWGTNNKGQLGDGSITNALVPITVETSGLLSGKTIDSISVGMNYTCATAAGQAYCWGYNNFGQLGNNSLVDSLVPVQV
ncbi:MAG TPA: RCC1 repeat-containing protein, partial [Candidatus Saccharibacteria bacterium]|nr:RCC1 repeat-containing protein [Candidatus Saccharibacteria bacterium]